MIYLNGEGVEPSQELAIKWLQHAADQNYANPDESLKNYGTKN